MRKIYDHRQVHNGQQGERDLLILTVSQLQQRDEKMESGPGGGISTILQRTIPRKEKFGMGERAAGAEKHRSMREDLGGEQGRGPSDKIKR